MEEKTVNKEMLTKNGLWLSRQGLYGQPYQSVMGVAWKTGGALLGFTLEALRGDGIWKGLMTETDYFTLLFQLMAEGTNHHS